MSLCLNNVFIKKVSWVGRTKWTLIRFWNIVPSTALNTCSLFCPHIRCFFLKSRPICHLKTWQRALSQGHDRRPARGEVGNSRASIPHQSLRVLCARKQFKSIFHNNIQHHDTWITKALTTRVKLMIERGRWGEEGSTPVRNFRVATTPKGSLPLPEGSRKTSGLWTRQRIPFFVQLLHCINCVDLSDRVLKLSIFGKSWIVVNNSGLMCGCVLLYWWWCYSILCWCCFIFCWCCLILWWCCLILWWCFSLPLPESLQCTELATSVFSVHQAPSVCLWITQTDSGSTKCGIGSSKTNLFMKSGSTPPNSVKLDKSKFVRTVLASFSTYTVPCPTSWPGMALCRMF